MWYNVSIEGEKSNQQKKKRTADCELLFFCDVYSNSAKLSNYQMSPLKYLPHDITSALFSGKEQFRLVFHTYLLENKL